MVSPVISEAAGDARNTTMPATSMGSPMRCRAAIRSITSVRNSGSDSAGSVPGVRMNVGGDRVHGDPVPAPFDGQAPGQCAMAALVMQ
jgi:hypothetical protein